MKPKRYLLTVDEDDQEAFILAIHSDVEDFQLAFQINKNSNSRFQRSKKDIHDVHRQVVFSRYFWDNHNLEVQFRLISNKQFIEKKSAVANSNTLFDLPVRNEVSLFSEFKQVDFFIISNDYQSLNGLLETLKSLAEVSMVYPVALEQFKNRSQLIFD